MNEMRLYDADEMFEFIQNNENLIIEKLSIRSELTENHTYKGSSNRLINNVHPVKKRSNDVHIIELTPTLLKNVMP